MSQPVQMVEMIFPEQANHYGTLFGGHALALMAKAAFVAAGRHAKAPVVMARSERADFATPVRVGEVLELVARVTRTGRSSMTVEVRGSAPPRAGSRWWRWMPGGARSPSTERFTKRKSNDHA